MNNLHGALQNGKVWCRRFKVDFNKEQFQIALSKVDPVFGSVLRYPLMLVLFKKINTFEWAKQLNRNEVRVIAYIASNAMCMVLRKEESNILKALGSVTSEVGTEYKVLFSKHSNEVCSLISSGIDARTKEKNNPSVANFILQKAREG